MDRATLDKVAKLARLELTEKESADFVHQLANALKSFEQISQVETAGVEPLVTPTEISDFWREDRRETGLGAEEILSNAPAKQGNLFAVPPVV